jgi:hypothetical protein
VVSEIRLYVEGGGKGSDKRRFREGFRAFFKKIDGLAGEKRIQVRIISCGARTEAHSDFLRAIETHHDALNILLVDSEQPVDHKLNPKEHLRSVDKWSLPNCSADTCHLMVQAMEAWFIADIQALVGFYGQDFNRNSIPAHQNVEAIPKATLEDSLRSATKKTKKGAYHKGKHSHEILKRIDPDLVCKRAPHCEKLFDVLTKAIETSA